MPNREKCMTIEEKIKGLGKGVFGVVLVAAFLAIPLAFLLGVNWLSETVYPWLVPLGFWTFAACVVVLAPAALIPATRGFAAVGLLFASYVFGFILWMWSFIVTMILWGWFAVILGLLFFGVGIVPVALLAVIVHAQWHSLLDITLMVVATFGTRILSYWLASTLRL